MNTSLLNAAFFLAFFLLQTSFISSLPGVLSLTPLLFVVGVYLVQHQSFSAGAWWIIAFGLLTDLLGVTAAPVSTLAHAAAAGVAFLSARHLFSNRSLYGVVACGILSLAVRDAVQAAWLGVRFLRHPETVLWKPFLDALPWEAALAVILLVILFSFAPKIRTMLTKTFLLGRSHETF